MIYLKTWQWTIFKIYVFSKLFIAKKRRPSHKRCSSRATSNEIMKIWGRLFSTSNLVVLLLKRWNLHLSLSILGGFYRCEIHDHSSDFRLIYECHDCTGCQSHCLRHYDAWTSCQAEQTCDQGEDYITRCYAQTAYIEFHSARTKQRVANSPN